MSVWVKICGVTRVVDALTAAEAGADAVGINFYTKSARYCTPQRAAEIVAALPRDIESYGVFVGATRSEIEETLERSGVGGIQFHGDEPLDAIRGWPCPVIRAVPVCSREQVIEALEEAGEYRLLLDHPSGGGSGRRFDESEVAGIDLGRTIVAGGLTPRSVADVVRCLRPYGVDTAGGVESAPGVKDQRLVREFVRHAKAA